MESLRELFLVLGLDADEAGFATAQTAVDALEAGLGLARDAVVALAKEMVSSVVETAEYAGTIGDMATATGTSAEWLQAMGFAAVQSGSSLDEVTASLGLLNRNLFAATSGNKEAAKAFAELHVRTKNADGTLRNTQEVFGDLADAFQKMPEGPERGARAMEIFGRSGAKLLPLLVEGREGLARMAQEADDFGVILEEDTIAQAKAFGDGLAALGVVVDSIKRDLGVFLIEAVTPLVEEFREWLRVNRQLITTRIKQFVSVVRTVIEGTVKVVRWLVGSIDDFILGAKLLAVVLVSYVLASLIAVNGGLTGLLVNFALNTAAVVAYGALSVATAAKAAIAWVAAAAPVIGLTAAFAFLFLVVDDFFGYLEGKQSFFGSYLDEWLRERPDDAGIVKFFKQIVRDLTDLETALKRLDKGESWFEFTPLGQMIKSVRWLMENADRLKATLLDASVALTTGKWGTAMAALEASRNTQSWVEGLTGQGIRAARQSVGVLSPEVTITINGNIGESPKETADRMERSLQSWWDKEKESASATFGPLAPQD